MQVAEVFGDGLVSIRNDTSEELFCPVVVSRTESTDGVIVNFAVKLPRRFSSYSLRGAITSPNGLEFVDVSRRQDGDVDVT